MKQVFVVQYTQRGQLADVPQRIVAPLATHPRIELTVETLEPKRPYPFPWPSFRFYDTFHGAVHLDPPGLDRPVVEPRHCFDLVLLGYQVWFLSPSLPVTALLESKEARLLLDGTPLVTVVACRDTWLMAQEDMKQLLGACGTPLVGHVARVDAVGNIGNIGNVFATPPWVMSGHKGRTATSSTPARPRRREPPRASRSDRACCRAS